MNHPVILLKMQILTQEACEGPEYAILTSSQVSRGPFT